MAPAPSSFRTGVSPLVPTTLQTSRLTLRPFRHEDWPELHAYYSDADATRYTVGRAFTEAESWRAMAGMAGHWMLRGFGPYCLEDKASGSVLGVAGLWWALARPHWGRGFASEAARAVQIAAARHLPNLHLISLIHEDNMPSIRLAEAVGAKFERTMDFRGSTARIYRHPHPSSLQVRREARSEAALPANPGPAAPE